MVFDPPGPQRKLGGILIETVTAGSQRLAVIGIGLNVMPMPVVSPATEAEWLEGMPPVETR